MKPFRLWCAVLLLLGGAIAFRTSAALLVPLSIEELKEHADLILHATVKSKACEQTPEGRIFTRVHVDVSEVLKGTLKTNAFQIVHGGGTIGNIRESGSAQVEYEVGEEVLVFLRLNDRGEGVTLGLVQGKFRVWADKATGEKFAHNPFNGITESEAAHDEKKNARLALKELSRRAKGDAK